MASPDSRTGRAMPSCGKSFWIELTCLMPYFTTTRRVNHAAAEMFDLVADVERYPQFVPLCRSLKVRRRTFRAGRHRNSRC